MAQVPALLLGCSQSYSRRKMGSGLMRANCRRSADGGVGRRGQQGWLRWWGGKSWLRIGRHRDGGSDDSGDEDGGAMQKRGGK
jgi:hypothetical protein